MVIQDCSNDLNRFKQKYEYETFINIFKDSQFVIDQLDIDIQNMNIIIKLLITLQTKSFHVFQLIRS